MDGIPARAKRIIDNPYMVGRPLTGASASLFVGREEVFDWLAENLSLARPNALLLYGRRRIGKTSTLYQMVAGERGRPLRERRERPIFAAYVDLQRLAGRPTDEWLRQFGREICRFVNTSSLARTVPDSPAIGETAYAAVERCLDRLEETLPAEGLILLAIDELEQIRAGIEAGSLSPDVIPYLRSQIQHREQIAFLLSGAHGLFDDFWRPIVDLAARFELGNLNRAQTAALIRQPVAGRLNYGDAAVDTIWQFTAGHPFLIQSVCHRLVSLMNRRHRHQAIRPADVERIIHQMETEGLSKNGVNASTIDERYNAVTRLKESRRS
jgi:hypothetical protein